MPAQAILALGHRIAQVTVAVLPKVHAPAPVAQGHHLRLHHVAGIAGHAADLEAIDGSRCLRGLNRNGLPMQPVGRVPDADFALRFAPQRFARARRGIEAIATPLQSDDAGGKGGQEPRILLYPLKGHRHLGDRRIDSVDVMRARRKRFAEEKEAVRSLVLGQPGDRGQVPRAQASVHGVFSSPDSSFHSTDKSSISKNDWHCRARNCQSQ